KNFAVKPNKEEYRVIKDDNFMLEFNGSMTFIKVSVKADGFVRYPLKLVDLDAIEPTENKYLIDKVYFSSTSSTMILDDVKILVIKALKDANCGMELKNPYMPTDLTRPVKGTIENLLIWAQNRKNNVHSFISSVVWQVDFPMLRYMLEMDVSNDTTQTVIVMFDETATALVGCSAGLVIKHSDVEASGDSSGYAGKNVVGPLSDNNKRKRELIDVLTNEVSGNTPPDGSTYRAGS
nr:hypothetical protein [Tanacetum cinerariifolium]